MAAGFDISTKDKVGKEPFCDMSNAGFCESISERHGLIRK